jgi:micrococcal nuclease
MSFAPPGTYRAQALRVIDGDTLELFVDLGFRNYKRDIFRLRGINTPELHAAEADTRAKALAAKTRLAELVAPVLMAPSLAGPWSLKITTQPDPEKYGRWLIEIETEGAVAVNTTLIAEGLAVPYDGGRRV